MQGVERPDCPGEGAVIFLPLPLLASALGWELLLPLPTPKTRPCSHPGLAQVHPQPWAGVRGAIARELLPRARRADRNWQRPVCVCVCVGVHLPFPPPRDSGGSEVGTSSSHGCFPHLPARLLPGAQEGLATCQPRVEMYQRKGPCQGPRGGSIPSLQHSSRPPLLSHPTFRCKLCLQRSSRGVLERSAEGGGGGCICGLEVSKWTWECGGWGR